MHFFSTRGRDVHFISELNRNHKFILYRKYAEVCQSFANWKVLFLQLFFVKFININIIGNRQYYWVGLFKSNGKKMEPSLRKLIHEEFAQQDLKTNYSAFSLIQKKIINTHHSTTKHIKSSTNNKILWSKRVTHSQHKCSHLPKKKILQQKNYYGSSSAEWLTTNIAWVGHVTIISCQFIIRQTHYGISASSSFLLTHTHTYECIFIMGTHNF